MQINKKIIMKNVIYWLLIIFCSIFSSIFILCFLFLGGIESFMSDPKPSVLFMLLMISGLIYGIAKIREKKKEKQQMKTVVYIGNLNLNFSGQISYKDYRNTSLELLCKKFWLFGIVLMILFIIFPLTQENFDFLSLFPWVFFLLVFTLLIIRSTKKIYRENKVFHEKLTYHLDNEKITIMGETVNSTYNWNRLFKIKETRTFFLLYHDSIIANWLDKKMFSAEEIIEFQKFANSLNIKKELKMQ